MHTSTVSMVSRRAILRSGAGLIAAIASRPLRSWAESNPPIPITAGTASVALAGESDPATDVWAYDSKIPGPVIRLKRGVPAKIVVTNKLDEDTTVHWHGIRLPNAMDGVPGLTQPPIRPGESFTYEFTPPDAGTYWYHPHANSLQQLGRGLAGALIIEEREPVDVDRDILWFISDWRLNSDAQIAAGFGNAMEAGMSGRIGNLVTINGRNTERTAVRAGERIRLRLVNASLARIMALQFDGHRPLIVAMDGNPCDPHEPDAGRILLGPAMRIDIILDMQGEPGRQYKVTDSFYRGLSYDLAEFNYAGDAPIRRHPGSSVRLIRNPLPEPDLAAAERHRLILQGGMMGGGGMMGMMWRGSGAQWAINGVSMTGDGHAGMKPALTFARKSSVILEMINDTAWWHPMHFHGHSFRVLTRNGTTVPHNQWQDTVLLPPRERVDVAFVADNPGDWMLHCHVMDHQVAGLMSVLRVA